MQPRIIMPAQADVRPVQLIQPGMPPKRIIPCGGRPAPSVSANAPGACAPAVPLTASIPLTPACPAPSPAPADVPGACMPAAPLQPACPPAQPRPGSCGCGTSAVDSCPASGSVAMVYPVNQTLSQTLPDANALAEGSLFPELIKPMRDVSTGPTMPCAVARQQSAFAAWELRLYLDTHPNDACALNMYRQKCRQLTGPDDACACVQQGAADGSWRWLDDPWPWAYQPCQNGTEGTDHVCV